MKWERRHITLEKQVTQHHDNKETKFKFDIIKYNRTPLERQIREGVEIVRTRADILLNSKIDHFQPGIRKITFGNILDDQEFGF